MGQSKPGCAGFVDVRLPGTLESLPGCWYFMICGCLIVLSFCWLSISRFVSICTYTPPSITRVLPTNYGDVTSITLHQMACSWTRRPHRCVVHHLDPQIGRPSNDLFLHWVWGSDAECKCLVNSTWNPVGILHPSYCKMPWNGGDLETPT